MPRRWLALVGLTLYGTLACAPRQATFGTWLSGIDPFDPTSDELRAHRPTTMSCRDESALTRIFINARKAMARRAVEHWYEQGGARRNAGILLGEIPKATTQPSQVRSRPLGSTAAIPARLALVPPRNRHSPKRPSAAADSAGTVGVEDSDLGEFDYLQQDRGLVFLGVANTASIYSGATRALLSKAEVPGTIKTLAAHAGRLLVVSSCDSAVQYPCDRHVSTVLTLFDVTQPQQPKVATQFQFTGALLDAKRVRSMAYVALSEGSVTDPLVQEVLSVSDPTVVSDGELSPASPEAAMAQLNPLLEQDALQALPEIIEQGKQRLGCDHIVLSSSENSTSFVSIVSIDLLSPSTGIHTITIPAGRGTIHVAPDALYLAVREGSPFADRYSADITTKLHQFRLGIRPDATTYLGSGVAPGELVDARSMAQFAGRLHVVTKYQTELGGHQTVNELSVFEPDTWGSLVRVGILRNIERGRQFTAALLERERAFAMTGETDPALLAFDLSLPQSPELKGVLASLGYESRQLRWAGSNHLLGLGRSRTTDPQSKVRQQVTLDIYDVSQRHQPRLAHREAMNGLGWNSELFEDERTFNYRLGTRIVTFPLDVCTSRYDFRHDDGYLFSGIRVIGVSAQQGFRRYTELDYAKDFFRPFDGQRLQRCGEEPSRTPRYANRSLISGNGLWLFANGDLTIRTLSSRQLKAEPF